MGTVDRLLADHVGFRVTSVDRVGIAGYIQGLQYEHGVVRFLVNRGFRIPSPAALDRNHKRLAAEVEALAAGWDVPLVRFAKGQSKEGLARPYQDAAAAVGRPGVVLVGKAQERVSSWRGFVDTANPQHRPGHPHITWRRQSSVPDHFYFYLWDDQWGPAFIKLCGYAPYPLWLGCSGHEWAKQQLTNAGVSFEALDNGLRSVADPVLARRLCARLSAGHVRGLLDRWLPQLPSPLTADDRRAGFGWSFSVRQLEVSDTAVFDAPRAARAWFEAAIVDHLDLGRPEQVALIVDRTIVNRGKHPTPGRFATKIITRDLQPQMQIHYKSSKAKVYLKEGQAMRVETTFNDASDFGVHKTLNAENWRALRRVGSETNRRFLAALGEGQPGLPDPATLESVILPTIHDGQRAPGLRFGDPRVMALFSSVVSFAHVIGGLTNKTLREHMSVLWNPEYTRAQATYDLRRLRLKGFIQRVEGTHTYQVTAHGRQVATFFTKLAARVIIPTLTDLETPLRPIAAPRPITQAWRTYERELDNLIKSTRLAA